MSRGGAKRFAREWQPLKRGSFANRAATLAAAYANGVPEVELATEAWVNDLYTVAVRREADGSMHLSLHRHDREPVRDWRHLQQIKNEVAGPFRWAVEIFPDERHLVDTTNEYHLWVLPEGTQPPVGFTSGAAVLDPADVPEFLGPSKARQRPWQPGLTTGRMGQREATLAEMLARREKAAQGPGGAS